MTEVAVRERAVHLAAHLADTTMAALCLWEGDHLAVSAASGIDADMVERLVGGCSLDLAVNGYVEATNSTMPGVQFLAGTAFPAGSLWVFDSRPRTGLTEREQAGLRELSAMVGAQAALCIAERRRFETMAVEVERSNRARSRFLAAASHDMRQPFQAIHLFLHLLLAKLTEPQHIELASRIQEVVISGEGLLNGLLDISTLEAGSVRPAVAPMPVGDLMERLIREFDSQSVDKGIRLRFVPCSAIVTSDPLLLERILRNFIANALRYTRTGSVLMGCRHQGENLRIEVWDTGPGIPADKLEAIFEEFYQLEGVSRDRGRGLGLGLAIVDRTARLLGHPVAVRSVQGKGSVFSVTVPRVMDPSARSNNGPVRIIVIEDDPVQLMAVRMILEGWGCDVVAVPTISQARTALASLKPELMISDLRLRNGETGLDAVRTVREAVGYPLPAIVVTGDGSQQRVRELQAVGAVLLQKPYGPEILRNTVQNAVGRPIGRRT
jgi:signal transduction histidine kinase/CheY-like chemotaxis protein